MGIVCHHVIEWRKLMQIHHNAGGLISLVLRVMVLQSRSGIHQYWKKFGQLFIKETLFNSYILVLISRTGWGEVERMEELRPSLCESLLWETSKSLNPPSWLAEEDKKKSA
jgi:hypothetical protein